MDLKKVKLGDVCRLKYGKALKKEVRKGGEIPVYGSGGIVGYHDESLVNHKTIIIGRKGSIGEVFYESNECWVIDTAYYIIHDASLIDLKWFSLILKTLNLKRLNKSAAIPGLNRNDFYSLKILLPTIEDQKRIAKVLSDCEALIQKREKSIELLDELLRSTFLEMFGDPIEMQKKELEKLEDYIDFLTSGSRGWAEYYSDFGAKFLRIQNIGNGHLKLRDLAYVNPPKSAEAKRTMVMEGDLLISITADLGRTAVIPKNFGEAYINQHLALVRLKKNVDPYYLAYFFSMPFGNRFIQKKNRSGVKSGLNFNDIKSFPVYIPQSDLQQKFSEIFARVEYIKQIYCSSLDELKILYRSISQRAFKGELDLGKVDISGMEDKIKPDIDPIVETSLDEGFMNQDDKINFNELIKSNFEKVSFSFDDLANAIQLDGIDYPFPYDRVKEFIFKSLEGEESLLVQELDKQEKQIIFRVRS